MFYSCRLRFWLNHRHKSDNFLDLLLTVLFWQIDFPAVVRFMCKTDIGSFISIIVSCSFLRMPLNSAICEPQD